MKQIPFFLCLLVILISAFVTSAQKVVLNEDSRIPQSYELIKTLDYNSAIKLLDEVILDTPSNFKAFYLRGIAKSLGNDPKGGVVDLTKFLDNAPKTTPSLEDVYTARGEAFLRLREFDKAIADFDQALKYNPRYAIAHSDRGDALLAKNDLKEALISYDKAIEIDERIITALDGRGSIFLLRGDLDKGFDDFEKALKIAPLSASSNLHRGIILGLKGYWFAAAESLESGLKIYTANGNGAWNDLSVPLGNLDKFIKQNSENGKALAVRGLIKKLQNKESDSAEDFKKAFDLEPELKTKLEISKR